MKIADQKLETNDFSYTVNLDANDLAEIRALTLKALQKDIKIPGFRPSKAPLDMVEKYVSKTKLDEEFINAAINQFYPETLEKIEYLIVSEPKIEVLKYVYNQTLDFKVSLEVIPKIELNDYKKIKISLNQEKPTEQDYQTTLAELKKRILTYKPVKRPVKLNDQVKINFKGLDPSNNNSKLDQASADNFDIVVGSNTFIPGFEDNLIGLKLNSEKSFKIKFPENYQEPTFKSKEVLFEVKVLEIKEPTESEFNTDNIKDFGPFKTVQEFKDEVKNQVKLEKEKAFEKQYNNQLLEKIAELVKNDIPASMLDKELQLIKEEERRYALYLGQTWEEYLANQKLTQAEYDKKAQEFASKRIKSGLAVSELVKQLQIKVSQDEVEKKLQELKNRYITDPEMTNQLNAPNATREVELQIVTEQVLDKVKKAIQS